MISDPPAPGGRIETLPSMLLQPFLDAVRRTVLPNGLTLLSREDPGTGVVAIVTWVRAGYFHEPDERAGMAHLLEHMFFKGSSRFPGPEEIAREVSALGGSTNAGTIYDSTSYHFVMPVEAFERGVEIQADAIISPRFDPGELAREAEVVIEESNRKLDSPAAVATERMYATAFTRHRMRRWRIGSDEVLRAVRREAIVEFFESLYRPSNMIVSIAGDLTHERAIEAVGRWFGDIPAGTLRKERGPAEPPQREFRFGQSEGDLTQSLSVFGWHTPGEGDAEEETFDLLSSILAGGRSSRLYREVVRAGGASSVSAYNSVFEDAGIFTIRASFDDAKLPEVEGRIAAEIERMRRFGPTEYETRLARNRIESESVFDLEDVLGQAQALAYYESRGGYARLADRLAEIHEITPARIREVASRHLHLDNLTLYRYRPLGTPRTETMLALGSLVSAVDAADPQRPRDEQPRPPGPELAPAGKRPLQRFLLSNGIVLFVLERPGTPSVATDLYFKGGRTHECSANAGITRLMARVMRRGSRRRNGDQIDREIEFLGTGFGLRVEEDYFGFSLDILRTHFAVGLELLADFVLEPTFPEPEVARERELQIASIRRALDSSTERPFQLFAEAFFGTHPYGFPSAGHPASVEAITREQLRGWFRDMVVSDTALMVVVGDVNAEAVRDLAESLFEEMPKSRALKRSVPPFVPPVVRRELAEMRRRKQTAMVVGFPTVAPQHPDWIVLRVLQDVASGLAGTFFAELRGRRSLAYTVYAADASPENAGAFVGYIASDASKERDALEGLIGEFRRLGEDRIGPEDLERAKAYIAGTTKIRLQTSSALAADLAHGWLFGLGIDFRERFLDRVRGVRLDEVRSVAKTYFSGDNYTVAILRGGGDPD